MAPDSDRCSVASALREEPLPGTAPTARRWLLIEHPGPWAKQPLDTAPLAGPVAERIETALAHNLAKLLLVRRIGRQPADHEAKTWRVVDIESGQSIVGSWRNVTDLDAAINALSTVGGPFGEPAPDLILVCTHGVRDACCAIKGRPVAGMVNKAFEGEVWECSHLNGHRFAGTALVLPSGACYGRLDQSNAVKVFTGDREGQVDPGHLRGLTSLSPAAQAAHVWGLAEVKAATPDAPRALGDIQIATISDPVDGRCTVEVVGLGESSRWVEVTAEQLPPHPLSCGKPGEVATAYRVAEVVTPHR